MQDGDREVRRAVAAPVAHAQDGQGGRHRGEQHDRDQRGGDAEGQQAEGQEQERDRRRVDEAIAGRDSGSGRRRVRIAAVEHVAGRLPESAVEVEGVAMSDRAADDGQREHGRDDREQADLAQAPERRERACQRAGMRDVRHVPCYRHEPSAY